jgi:hypothetical protein
MVRKIAMMAAFSFCLLAFFPVETNAQLVSEKSEELYRSMLPVTDQERWNKLFQEGDLLFYTEREMPKAYQQNVGGGPQATFHWANYNISGDTVGINGRRAEASKPHGAGGNANVEFPWKTPGGLHDSPNTENFKFMHLPVVDGNRLPVVYWNERLPDATTGSGTGLKWVFPKGAILGECLMLIDPTTKQKYTFEVRMRVRGETAWDVEILRPFPTSKSLAKRIRELRPVEEVSNNQLVAHAESEFPVETRLLYGPHPTNVSFREEAGIDNLPATDPALIRELLTTTEFKSAVGLEWREDDRGQKVFAPTTAAAFHIVPKNYKATFLGTDTESCMSCHNATHKHTTHFDAPRQWYGHVRGSDGIFSFHPVDPSCVADNGATLPVVIRKSLLSGGYVARYDQGKHGKEHYRIISDLMK